MQWTQLLSYKTVFRLLTVKSDEHKKLCVWVKINHVSDMYDDIEIIALLHTARATPTLCRHVYIHMYVSDKWNEVNNCKEQT